MVASLRSILLVDGNVQERERLAVTFRKEIGCVVFEAGDTAEAMDIIEKQDVCLLITDLFFPSRSGIELLRQVNQCNPEVVKIACVPTGDREVVMEVLKLGAIFYINTPYDLLEAVIAAANGLRYHDVLVHKEKRGSKIRKSESFYGMVGEAPRMRELYRFIEKVADDSSSTVLIQGESGTGKELVARAIHAHSARKGKNFVPLNCAAIPENLLESELFGYVKGAFTGATQSKIGRIQYAEGGTLFLDEIGDMKPTLQAKLLRVLQEKEFEPVGGVKPVPADVRVVAATHRNLERLVADGGFREDLYYRLSVVPITIPPLRQRVEDIPLLIEKFIQVFNRNKKQPLKGFTPSALQALVEYPWPGNVRELENLVQRMAILCGGMEVDLEELPEKYRAYLEDEEADFESTPAGVSIQERMAGLATAGGEGGAVITPAAESLPWQKEGVDFNALISDFEDRLIVQAMTVADGNKKEAARLLGLKRTTLIEKIKKKGLEAAFPERVAG